MQAVLEQIEEEKRRQRAQRDEEEEACGVQRSQRKFFMPDGRPFNMNEGRLTFRLQDDR
jgi:hypothetical protein